MDGGSAAGLDGPKVENMYPVTWIEPREEDGDGRKARHVLALSSHKSFSEPLIHFTKRAVL